MGVSKRQPAERVVGRGARRPARRRRELRPGGPRRSSPKFERCSKRAGYNAPRWHFIGQLQRNKARAVARDFDVVQTVDRESLGAELDRRAAQPGRAWTCCSR